MSVEKELLVSGEKRSPEWTTYFFIMLLSAISVLVSHKCLYWAIFITLTQSDRFVLGVTRRLLCSTAAQPPPASTRLHISCFHSSGDWEWTCVYTVYKYISAWVINFEDGRGYVPQRWEEKWILLTLLKKIIFHMSGTYETIWDFIFLYTSLN